MATTTWQNQDHPLEEISSTISNLDSDSRPSIHTLPFELFSSITSYLSRRDLHHLCLVSRKAYHFTIPCLYRDIALPEANFLQFLVLWNEGYIPRQNLQYVQKLHIVDYKLLTERVPDTAAINVMVKEKPGWKYLLDSIKTGDLVGLKEVEVEYGSDCIALEDTQTAERVLKQLANELPQNITLSVSSAVLTHKWNPHRSIEFTPEDYPDYTPALNVLKILTKTRPIISIDLTVNWDAVKAVTWVLTKYPAVFNHHLRDLEITFASRPRYPIIISLMSPSRLSAKIEQQFFIPSQLVRLENLFLRRENFSSLPPNLKVLNWMSTAPRRLPLSDNTGFPDSSHAWGAISRLRHLKRLEIKGMVFDYFSPKLTSSVEFTGLETFIVTWEIVFSLGLVYSHSSFPAIEKNTDFRSMIDAVISSNPRLKTLKLSGLSGPSLRIVGAYGNLEMLEILDHFPYFNGGVPSKEQILDDDFLALTACTKLHYLRFRRILPRPILSQLVEACEFRPPAGKPVNWRDYGIYIFVRPDTCPPSPVEYYQDPKSMRACLGPEWVDVPPLEEGEEPGGINGYTDGLEAYERHDVRLDLDAVM